MNNLKSCRSAFASMLLASLCGVTALYAGPITVPAGLTPGEQYRLIFVTDDSYTATSSDIADYNFDVNTEADSVAALAALSTTWLDIGSTATVNAIDNIGIDAGVPIYDLNGDLIASDAGTGSGGLFSGGELMDGLGYDETGTLIPGSVSVWTGTYINGTPDDHNPLGTAGTVTAGSTGTTSGFWIAHHEQDPSTENRLYAISETLTVPTPEPGSVALISLAGAALMLFRRYSRPNAVPVPATARTSASIAAPQSET
jgi:hypothetical protein